MLLERLGRRSVGLLEYNKGVVHFVSIDERGPEGKASV